MRASVVWLAAACSGETSGPEALPAHIRPVPELTWEGATLQLQPDGRSEAWSFSLLDGPRAFAVRSALEPAADACFQLEDVTLGSGETWVGDATTADFGDYCLTCAERVAVGAGYGLSVLPSGAEDARDLGSVSLRVALRDCVTLTPLSAAGAVRVEHSSWSPPPPEQRLSLPFSVLLATRFGFADDDDPLLTQALTALQRTWSAAGIDLTRAGVIRLDAPAAAVEYAPDDRSRLIALTQAARAALDVQHVSRAWPAIVFTPCLRRSDPITHGRSEPLAFTPHVPGGFGLGDEPDLIFVAAERCEGLSPGPRFLDPDTLGAVLAHELGHYFGLFHVLEQDGRSDNLSDTSPDRLNLMQAMPSAEALTLTDSQIHVVRRHPIFVDASR